MYDIMNVYMYECIYDVWTWMYMYVWMYGCNGTWMLCMYVCMYVAYVCMYVCFICMYVCM
jgi:hypothetical protein